MQEKVSKTRNAEQLVFDVIFNPHLTAIIDSHNDDNSFNKTCAFFILFLFPLSW